MLTFNGTEEKAIEKAIAGLVHIIPLEAMPPPHFPTLSASKLNLSITAGLQQIKIFILKNITM